MLRIMYTIFFYTYADYVYHVNGLGDETSLSKSKERVKLREIQENLSHKVFRVLFCGFVMPPDNCVPRVCVIRLLVYETG